MMKDYILTDIQWSEQIIQVTQKGEVFANIINSIYRLLEKLIFGDQMNVL